VPYTLLLADDSVTIQRVIELTFADEDVKVIAVSDGDQAIVRAESSPPDIVLADIGMPGKNGYEVAKHIKQTPALSHIPVVLLTGAFEPVDQERASEAGCDGVLAKPFEPQLVISRVKDLLAKSAPRTATSAPPAASTAAPDVRPAAAASPAAAVPSVAPPPAVPPPPVATVEDDTLTLPADGEWSSTIGQAFAPRLASSNRNESLDDYFDRLDDAFQKLGAAAPSPAASAASAPSPDESPDLDWFRSDAHKGDLAGQSAELVGVADAIVSVYPTEAAPIAEEQELVAAPIAAPPPPEVVPDPPSAPPAAAAVAASAPVFAHGAGELPKIAALPSLADAFAAILAAEQGEPIAASWPATTPSTDALVEQVTQRVLDRLSDQVVRDTVSDIVSQIAERLVLEEIERIKAALK
jgi:CheY-like chemotaxis protein